MSRPTFPLPSIEHYLSMLQDGPENVFERLSIHEGLFAKIGLNDGLPAERNLLRLGPEPAVFESGLALKGRMEIFQKKMASMALKEEKCPRKLPVDTDDEPWPTNALSMAITDDQIRYRCGTPPLPLFEWGSEESRKAAKGFEEVDEMLRNLQSTLAGRFEHIFKGKPLERKEVFELAQEAKKLLDVGKKVTSILYTCDYDKQKDLSTLIRDIHETSADIGLASASLVPRVNPSWAWKEAKEAWDSTQTCKDDTPLGLYIGFGAGALRCAQWLLRMLDVDCLKVTMDHLTKCQFGMDRYLLCEKRRASMAKLSRRVKSVIERVEAVGEMAGQEVMSRAMVDRELVDTARELASCASGMAESIGELMMAGRFIVAAKALDIPPSRPRYFEPVAVIEGLEKMIQAKNVFYDEFLHVVNGHMYIPTSQWQDNIFDCGRLAVAMMENVTGGVPDAIVQGGMLSMKVALDTSDLWDGGSRKKRGFGEVFDGEGGGWKQCKW